MTLKLNHLHLKAEDPEQTVRSYVDNLGAKIVSSSRWRHKRLVRVRPGFTCDIER